MGLGLPWAALGRVMPPGPVNPIVVPGGSCQYYAVHQYSVVRRVWGPGRLAMF